MLYAILAYHEEHIVAGWSEDEDAAVMERLNPVHRRLTEEQRLGPAARLGPTQLAVTLRKGEVLDGPFAETKEQLLGLYLVDCANRQAAIEIARELQAANPTAVYEIRQIPVFLPGADLA